MSDSGHDAVGANTNPSASGSGDILGALDGLEAQLTALKKTHEEQARTREELAKRAEDLKAERAELDGAREAVGQAKQEIEAKAEELRARGEQLQAERNELNARSGDLDERELSLDERLEQITRTEGELENARAQLAADGERLAATNAELEARGADLDRREAEARTRNEELERLGEQLAERTAEVDALAADVKRRHAELDERGVHAERIEALEREADDLRERINGAGTELEQTKSSLDQTKGELEQERHRCREVARKAERLQAALDAAVESTSDEVLEARGEAERLETQLRETRERMEAAVAEAQAQAQAARDEAGETIEALRAELESLRTGGEDADAARAELGERLAEAEARAAALDAELTRIRESADSGDEEMESLREALATSERRVVELMAELGRANERAEQAKAVGGAEGDAGMEALTAELEATREELASVRADADARVAKATEAVEMLMAQLEEARRANGGAAGSVDEAWCQTRRERLMRQRNMLRGQSAKLKKATAALRDRVVKCEELLARRQELAQACTVFAEQQQRAASREARSGVLLSIAAIAATFAAVAGIAWFVSGRVAPGLHAAQATIRADAGSRDLTPDDLESWGAFVTGTIEDPAFAQSASERLARRGIESLSRPGDLQAALKDGLTIEQPEPGVVVFEYRDEGTVRTRRVLDTVVSAVASTANHTRARRTDGATTVVANPATVDPDPLDDTRLYNAGMIFGGGTVGMMVLGSILWSRMRKSKERFEQDNRVVSVLEEEGWDAP